MVSFDLITKAGVNIARLSMQAKDLATNSTQQAGRAAFAAKDWAVENPFTAAGVVAAPAAAVVAAPLALGAAGFTAGGVAAGRCTHRFFLGLHSVKRKGSLGLCRLTGQ